MFRPFLQALDVRASGFHLKTEMNVVAGYLKASVREVPIYNLELLEYSVSKLNTIQDRLRILTFALRICLTFASLQPFLVLSNVMLLITSLLCYRVVLGFLRTGWPYSTTVVAAASYCRSCRLLRFNYCTVDICWKRAGSHQRQCSQKRDCPFSNGQTAME